jgi:hypothetical protein
LQLNDKLLTSGIVLALAAVVTVIIMPDDEIDQNTPHNASSASVNITKQSRAKIDYVKEEVPIAYGKAVATESIQKEIHQKWDPAIETKALDTTKTFEIAIVNPNRDPEHIAQSYVPVSGRIDGRHFIIKVPTYLIKNNSSGINIQVKNLKTGKTSSTPISFMDELKDITRSAHLNIDSQNIDDYEYTSEEKILPVPGERYINN